MPPYLHMCNDKYLYIPVFFLQSGGSTSGSRSEGGAIPSNGGGGILSPLRSGIPFAGRGVAMMGSPRTANRSVN